MSRLLLLSLLVAMHAPLWAASADAIVGFWMVDSEDAIIHIVEEDGLYKGKLAWLRESHYPLDDPRGIGGEPVADRQNPDPELRSAPLVGMTILKQLQYDGMELWRNGRVYNSENGKTYDCRIWLTDRQHLNLRGFLTIPFLGATTTWTRVEAPM